VTKTEKKTFAALLKNGVNREEIIKGLKEPYHIRKI
jgi:hypothetical protein